MNLETEKHLIQQARWPKFGRHILAQFTETTVIVYQAYRPEIGRFAAENGYFGGAFSFSRMSWVKPNFLWMMYRSGWGTKPDQEVTLAIHLQRTAFDLILSQAVHSAFDPTVYSSGDKWAERVRTSDVRLQWDPDHGPSGEPLERRAIQLGMRGETLARFAGEWIVRIDDVSNFVAEQREHVRRKDWNALVTPREEVYPVCDASVGKHLAIEDSGSEVRS